MKKKFNKLLTSIKNINLELISCIILLLWTISPTIEYILKHNYKEYYTHYFSNTIYIIGSLGFIIYIIHIIKTNKNKKTNIKQFIPEIFLILLLLISLIASIKSGNQHLSFFGEKYRKEGLIVYIMYIGIALLSSTIKDSKYIKYIFKSIIINCLIIAIIPLFKNNFTYINFTNIFHNSNHYGYYLMINTMLAIFMFIDSKKLLKKCIYTLIYIFFLYLLIRNDTFGSYLAIVITLIFLFIYSIIKRYELKKIIFIISIFILTSFVVSHYDIKIGERVNFQSTKGIIIKNFSFLTRDIKGFIDKDKESIEIAGSYRGLLWKIDSQYIIAHPLFGGGMECLKDYNMNYSLTYNTHYSDRPHNIILQVAAFIGIPGAIIYLTLIIYIAITNLTIMKQNMHTIVYYSAMCYFISSLFGNSMYYTSPYFMILLGLLIGFNRLKKTNNS